MRYLSACYCTMLLLLSACNAQVADRKINTVPVDTTAVAATTTDTATSLARIYSTAIADYIASVKIEYALSFDTLYFFRHVYGQPDDFPDIELPKVIEHTNIRLIPPHTANRGLPENKSVAFINLMGWVDSAKAEFILVTFFNNGTHQFDYSVNYKVNTATKMLTQVSSKFQNYLFRK